jgi:hypothetical protein
MGIEQLDIGVSVSNEKVSQIFHCGIRGGIRISKKEKAIVLIADYRNQTYLNRWVGNTLHYVAAGTHGDQSLDYYRNAALINAESKNVTIYLFEKYSANSNIYRGIVEVVGEPAEASGPDLNMEKRKIYIFQLRPCRKKINKSDYVPLEVLEITIHDDPEEVKRIIHHQENELLRTPAQLTPTNYAVRPDEAILSSHLAFARRKQEAVNEQRVHAIESALWRVYASEKVEIFLQIVEAAAKDNKIDIVIPHYDLERGSIKGLLNILVAVTTIAGSTISGIAEYPNAKKNLPELIADVESIVDQTRHSLVSKMNVAVTNRIPSVPTRWPNLPLGPAPNNQKRDD